MPTDTLPDRTLFRRWPELAQHIAFVELGEFPTTVTDAAALADELDIGLLNIKRDDLSGADYGGNKIRKLEFLLGDALAQNKTHVITFGGLGSNHAIATSLYAKKLGLICGAILTPEPKTDAVKTTLQRHAKLGTHIAYARDYKTLHASEDELRQKFGDSVYKIPFGGSAPLGALGFVSGALELAEQIEAGVLAEPDIIYMACGTAGSVAGLALGLAVAGINSRIEAVQVTPDSLQPRKLTEKLVQADCDILRPYVSNLPDTADVMRHVNVRNDQLGEGYALPTAESVEAAELWQLTTGLPVSLTYTAKALGAIVKDARENLLAEKQVLFWNTYNSRPY